MTLIGIDGGKNTGWAMYETGVGLVEVDTINIYEAYHRARGEDPDNTVIFVEDPAQNSLYRAKKARNKMAAAGIGRDIGRVMRESEIIMEFLMADGFVVRPVQPKSSKWSPKLFKQITKWTETTSEHARDAVKLVYGMNVNQRQLEMWRKIQNEQLEAA